MTSSGEKGGEMSPAEYAKMHQRAFRVTFDFLTSHFPPGDDAAWWEKAVKDMTDASVSCAENKLVVGLLTGVFEYLSCEYDKRRKMYAETAN